MLYATATARSAPVFGLRREIDRLFEDTFGRDPAGQHAWMPTVDICETDYELTFVVELPGMKAEDVDVSALDGVLTIQGERLDERTAGQEERYHLVERNYGSFVRRFQLPPGLDGEKILADVRSPAPVRPNPSGHASTQVSRPNSAALAWTASYCSAQRRSTAIASPALRWRSRLRRGTARTMLVTPRARIESRRAKHDASCGVTDMKPSPVLV